MKRKYLNDLANWIKSSQRKPIVIRGARQVGKTWLVRQFAELQGMHLIEINLEKRPEFGSLFKSNDPKQILLNLQASLKVQFDPENSILFLDEIQAVPELFAKLRWFFEDMPKLPVIAAGSLLEFVLEEHTFSMPVGRIQYMYIEPLSFEEFLLAKNNPGLLNFIENIQIKNEIPIAIHQQLMSLVKEYTVVGGMPAAVASWIKEQSLTEINQIHHDLISTYRDDFAKYSGRLEKERLDEVMLSVPKNLGKKFVYSEVNPTIQSNSIKQALDLLCKAKICHKVLSCHANGLPLGTEVNEKFFKVIFLDVGLSCAALGLTLTQISQIEEIVFINRGGIAEQITGQLLRTIEPSYIDPKLYYWIRHEKGASAEIDYIMQKGTRIIPIEVKAGSEGSLKSLHIFMNLKNLSIALRIYSSEFSQTHVQMKDSLGHEAKYALLSVPFYLIGQLPRLLTVSA